MKKLVIALALIATVSPALAGGLTEPAMDAAVVAAETSSGGDNWVGVMMMLLVLGAAVSK